jgi:glucan phosphoethanolaminetransferase (alkaline phosphatase superfamily)
MVFWLAILAGAFFAWFAVKIGFYETWVMLFNTVISIYIAIFLTPVIVDIITAAGDTSYGNALTLIATAIGTFMILYGISYALLTDQNRISFPRIFDILFTGLLGFLAGFLVLSFAALLICVTPISQNKFVKEAGLSRQSQQANISYICFWCDFVNSMVSSRNNGLTSEQAINKLLKSDEKKSGDKTIQQTEPNKPVESSGDFTGCLSPGALPENPAIRRLCRETKNLNNQRLNYCKPAYCL